MKDSIKIQLIEVRKKTKEAYNKFPPIIRGKVHHENFLAKPGLGRIPLNELNSKQKIAELVWREAGVGTYYVCGTKPNKHTITGFSPGALVRITLRSHPSIEHDFEIVEWKPMRLKRYIKMLEWEDESIY